MEKIMENKKESGNKLSTATCLLLPDENQRKTLESWFANCAELWNMILVDKIDRYEKKKNVLGITAEDLNQFPYIMGYIGRPGHEYMKETDFSVYKNVASILHNHFGRFVDEPKKNYLPTEMKTADVKCICMEQDGFGSGKISFLDSEYVFLRRIGNVKIKMFMPLPDSKFVKKCYIRKDGKNYLLRAVYECAAESTAVVLDKNKAIGLDYSPYHFYVDSNGYSPEFTGEFKNLQKKLKVEQRRLSKAQKGSNSYYKILDSIIKVEEKIVNSRKDFLRKEAHRLVEEYDYIFLETVSMEEMANGGGNGKDAKPGKGRRKAVYSAGFDDFRLILARQAEKKGKVVHYLPAYTKTTYGCHVCGKEYEYKGTQIRSWTCPKCGTFLDRDENAAINIKELGMRDLVATGQCGRY